MKTLKKEVREAVIFFGFGIVALYVIGFAFQLLITLALPFQIMAIVLMIVAVVVAFMRLAVQE